MINDQVHQSNRLKLLNYLLLNSIQYYCDIYTFTQLVHSLCSMLFAPEQLFLTNLVLCRHLCDGGTLCERILIFFIDDVHLCYRSLES